MSVSAYNPAVRELPTSEPVAEQYGEDPARFLCLDDLHLAFARIRGINDLELLEAWRAVETSKGGDRRRVHRALDAREREILGEPVDSSTSSEKTETGPAFPDVPEAPTPDPSPNHPDSRLETDEVLVIPRGDRTEYVTPASAGADAPYVSRTLDENGDVWNENDDLRNDDLLRRLNGEHERTTTDEVSAALGGGA
ncbi:hypothetical protein [Natronosalvus caseinilyticus]|uniref:hypothetical protein n=1 Tax=Natronosalvus caseinilyticus TaxID=2953747 RepID=UPI0028ABA27E|nr:hypothetical protein [Natronosalvus caseinilyticus]